MSKKIPPCPCCGNKDLYSGHASAMSMGVECHPQLGGCGLKLSIGYDEIPHIKGQSLKQYEATLLDEAISRWSRRND